MSGRFDCKPDVVKRRDPRFCQLPWKSWYLYCSQRRRCWPISVNLSRFGFTLCSRVCGKPKGFPKSLWLGRLQPPNPVSVWLSLILDSVGLGKLDLPRGRGPSSAECLKCLQVLRSLHWVEAGPPVSSNVARPLTSLHFSVLKPALPGKPQAVLPSLTRSTAQCSVQNSGETIHTPIL